MRPASQMGHGTRVFKTEDDYVISLDESIYRRFKMLKKMPRDMQAQVDEEGTSLEIDVQRAALSRIIDWCRHHPEAERDEPLIEIDPCTAERRIDVPTTRWETGFFAAMAFEELCDLLNACYYLEVKQLYLYACQFVAARVKEETTVEGIRRLLNISARRPDKGGRNRRARVINPWVGGADDHQIHH